MTRRLSVLTLGAASALMLSACISLGGKPPPFLLTLAADAAPAAGQSRSSSTGTPLTILAPTAPQKLQTQRVPVQQDGASIAYVKDAQWVEAPQRLFQRLLSETITARSNRVVFDEGQYLAEPGDQLAGQLLDFGVDARSHEAVVVYQAMLVTADGKQVTQQRFEAREPIGHAVEAKPVGEALTRAANRVAGEVAAWVEK